MSIIFDGTSGQIIQTGTQSFSAPVAANSTVTINSGTANGVAYLNGSKVLTTGSALTFDGTNFTSGAHTLSTGNLNFTGTAQRIAGDFSNATGANRVAFQTSTVNGNTTVGLLPNGSGNGTTLVAFNGSDPSNANPMQIRATASEAGLFLGANGTASGIPMTFWNGGSERVRLDTSGNVGIGTSLPGAKLDVTTDSTNDGGIFLTADGSSFGYASNITFRSKLTPGGSIGVAAKIRAELSSSNNAGLLFFTTASGTNAEKMRLDSSGNVGIGTSSPAYKLVVSNTGAQGFEFDPSSGIFQVFNRSTSAYGQMLQYASILRFFTGASPVETMRIDSSGNVGIGTTSPATRLELSKVYVGAGPTWAGGDDLLKLTAASGSAWGEPAIAFHEIGSNIGAKIGVKNSGNGAMNIIFANRDGSSLTSTMTERMRINVNGAVVLQGGDTSASGVGITFPATQTASSNANTLDDYEEGTYTPSSDASSNLSSITFVEGRYVKIGRLVTVWVRGTATITSSGTKAWFTMTAPFAQGNGSWHYSGNAFFEGSAGIGFPYATGSVVDASSSDSRTFCAWAASAITFTGTSSFTIGFTYESA